MSKRLPKDPQKSVAILSAATHEFAKKGYFKASTQTIAEQAQVSKGTVFRYFDNKKTLYTQAINYAIERLSAVVDYSIWTNAPDLVHLIIRATQYKLQLSHRFPDEFALLIAVYRQGKQMPPELQRNVQKLFDQFSAGRVEELVTPVIERQTLRQDIPKAEVENYVHLVMNAMMSWIQAYMTAHPEVKTMEDMDEIVTKIKHFTQLLEKGIVAL